MSEVETGIATVSHELSVEQVIARINKVHDVMKRAMQDGHHYGVIPGTPKPTLLKPGAELLCVMFRLDPQYGVTTERDGKHLTVNSTCTLWHVPTGQRCGSGMGSCSTRESKYAYRQAKRACPKCGAEQINKSKFPPKGRPQEPPGWYCYAKTGGCGQEFAADDPAITGQVTGRVVNEDLADQENTVLKMANKRSLVAAVLNVTAASDIFTQDLEDTAHEAVTPNKSAGDTVESRPEPAESGRAATPREPFQNRPAQTVIGAQEDHTDEATTRQSLLGALLAHFDMKRLKQADRLDVWKRYLSSPHDPERANLEELQALLDSYKATVR